MNDFAYTDIIILALIAGFVLLRLRNTLGKDIGHKPDLNQLRHRLQEEEAERVIHIGEAAEAQDKREEKDALSLAEVDDPEVSRQLVAMREADPQFSVREFLEGARSAFEWVVTAFNKGDRATLKQLMSSEVFEDFKAALDEREALGTKPETTLVAIKSADIIDAKQEKEASRITVRFVTEQIQVERDAGGKIVSGDASRIHEIEDEWMFEHVIKSRNPNWTIIDT